MGSASKRLSALFAVLCLALIFHETLARHSSAEDFVKAHNAVRAEVGVGPMKWSPKVAAYARKYARTRKADCQLIHSNSEYGENILIGSTATAAVYSWAGEKEFYNYTSNTCAPGKSCGHYTQVVWADSVELGCARMRCHNGNIFITCNYNQPGNYIGTRPY